MSPPLGGVAQIGLEKQELHLSFDALTLNGGCGGVTLTIKQ
ncbi:hypothetical protein [Candidatus Ichthyocystis sparus]|nr:hypothetical protein [Candidatus Ichthyocystis sparus]